ncbi:peptide chain release factor 1 [Puniceicoccus vermicola]|uniref:Peptide chain release factor 1 n=1 Tax=Puniceicoccus vermicola TaxID=388746 RepID=A0A7X1AZU0_9BACT|nr:peptide chain release factor 1 [Puniceicoccus vermicola]MBC2602829.1 peptide chain release factor 1 [Puniceicoccus vermicola]
MHILPSTESIREKLSEKDREMSDPSIFGDGRKAAACAREHQRLTRLLNLSIELRSLESQIEESRELLKDSNEDPEIREMAETELPDLEERSAKLEEEITLLVVPSDPADSRNTVMEIRAGAGGDEASLFAADLFRMYSRFAETQGWRIEPMSSSLSDTGGYKEIIFLVTGEEVYRLLKFESGVHRVQRVPTTETNGRIHTSTATVAVLPEAEEVDLVINPEELEITVSRASGPGGQGVNTTDSAVQILHKPTGMIVSCADERSQIKNKAKAMKVLRSRLLQQKQEEERAKYAADRRNQVGSGDRSERIRTYNFPQSRLTDHRINWTTHDLDGILAGSLQEVLDALLRADIRAKAEAALAESTS